MKKAKFLCPGTYDPDLDKGEANDGSSITIEDELTDLNEILGRMVAGQNDLLFRHPDLEGEDDDDMDGIPHQRFTDITEVEELAGVVKDRLRVTKDLIDKEDLKRLEAEKQRLEAERKAKEGQQ